jgi:hypothetical protein
MIMPIPMMTTAKRTSRKVKALRGEIRHEGTEARRHGGDEVLAFRSQRRDWIEEKFIESVAA